MDVLLKKRSSQKGRLTIFKNFLEQLPPVEQLTDVQVNELKLRLSRLNVSLEGYDAIQTEIESLSDNSPEQLKIRDEIENIFFNLMSKAQTILDNVTKLSAQSEKDIKLSRKSYDRENSMNSNNVKLPTIKLPTFDGNYEKWIEYRDTFDSLINKNDSIEAINKFHYLRSSLEGGAALVIKSMEFSATSYSAAWELLCQRFDNKRLLIVTHMKQLFAIDCISRESDRSLRSMIDHISKNLRALKSLGQPVEYWDTIVIHLASTKLDNVTNRNWEEYKGSLKDIPTLEDFFTFLRNKADVLETVKQSKSVGKPEKVSSFVASASASENGQSAKLACIVCKQDHRLCNCPQFISMNLEMRNQVVSRNKLCINCFRKGHYAYNCKSIPCKVCKYKHNTLLHRSKPQTVNNESNVSPVQAHLSPAAATAAALPEPGPVSLSATTSQHVLLSTALVKIVNKQSNKFIEVRALLDSGSQITIITESLRQKLGLQCKPTSQPVTVTGISNAKFSIVDSCEFQMKSRNSEFSVDVNSLVVPCITNALPNAKVNIEHLQIPADIELADPRFYEPAEIHVLIGADLFWELIAQQRMKLGEGKPILQDSKLGWIVSGPVGTEVKSSQKVCCKMMVDLSQQLERFWKIDELPGDERKDKISPSDLVCEQHFTENTQRLENGRFCVKMPFHTPPAALGDSFQMAKIRFLNMEKKFRRQPDIKKPYVNFIKEYEELGHLSQSPRPAFGYCLPHHAVLREKSETTKLRVVFDASAKTSNGLSLNDIQMVGPTIQDDLISILLRFRQHTFVLTADIEKMYRQILIHESQRNLQMIVWRDNEDDSMKYFKLNTVTYGTASAPFLSTRCLLQLSEECNDVVIKEIIKHDFYMDDLITGSESEEELSRICNSVTQVLDSACFNLRKYRTNANLTFDKSSVIENKFISDSLATSSTLGLTWSPASDTLQFSIHFQSNETVTKRIIISETAKIFDPLGLLSIFIVKSKILYQKLWSCKLDWDEPVVEELKDLWIKFVMNMNALSDIHVPRHVLCKDFVEVQLHIFSDASLSAYGACVYTRSVDQAGAVHVNLLCSKSRVAPLKKLTIPKLELCGAYLAAQLGNKVRDALRYKISRCVFWVDSTIVLEWIHAPSNKKSEVFVANRVTKIKELSKDCEWRHVPTEENPADLISRGVDTFTERISTFWWKGPTYLQNSDECWPCLKEFQKQDAQVNLISEEGPLSHSIIIDFKKYSKLYKLKRIMAYVLRFVNNCRNKDKNNRLKSNLSTEELNKSQVTLVKLSQKDSFEKELNLLTCKRPLPKGSNILSLNPFLDDLGIMRVGGRIENSSFSYDKKHPMLLSSKHYLAKLIFEAEHIKLMHGGPQLLLCSVRENYWVTNARYLARSVPNNCILCRRLRGKSIIPIMGNLPKQRLTPGIPFETTGVDFAGPFYITDRKGRGCKISKCYLSLFVCFATKALHLEAVSDLTKDAFLLALRRFVSRRGKPSNIFCDNGTNFVGASNELAQFVDANKELFNEFGIEENLIFTFSPAYSPNFGGLWEAGVKSAKFHVKRILGNRHLTFEELATLFSQVEAILNSRPLCPLSTDPNDLSPLTPGHFLIGKPLTSVPAPDLTDKKLNRLDRYELLESMRQHFWRRWQNEYVTSLQQRMKWKRNCPGLRVGDMVVVKEENCPPLKWRIGRIQKLYPGSDGVARVADVFTRTGIVRRAFSRLCPLLPDEEKETLLKD